MVGSAERPRRALRPSVGIRRSPARAAAAGLPLPHWRRRAALSARRDRVVQGAWRTLRDDERARRVSMPVAYAPRAGGRIGRPARILLALSLLAAFVVALRGLDSTRTLEALTSVHGGWVAAASLCYL